MRLHAARYVHECGRGARALHRRCKRRRTTMSDTRTSVLAGRRHGPRRRGRRLPRSRPTAGQAAANDRFEDYIICTGAVSLGPRKRRPTASGCSTTAPASCSARSSIARQGKIVGWAEVDLVSRVRHPAAAERPFPDDDRQDQRRARRPCTSPRRPPASSASTRWAHALTASPASPSSAMTS